MQNTWVFFILYTYATLSTMAIQSVFNLVTEKLISIMLLYHIFHSIFMENLSLCLFFILLLI